MPIAFRNHEGGMSTDWANYSTPKETQERVKLYGKFPENYGVINMVVADVRKIEGQQVIHKPLPENYSHTDVEGEKTDKVRLLFLRIYKWEIEVKKRITIKNVKYKNLS
ncbi:MAG: hypothetical protein WKG06_41975 [Segetibacter sp.]